MRLDDKVCLITGGTKGIGAATAIAFARLGAHLSINGREDDEAAQRTKHEIEALGRRCCVVAADVGKPEEAIRCVHETLDALGRIDVLVHSAGGRVDGDLLCLPPQSWYLAFDVHVHAIFHLCRAAVPHMKGNGEGAIVLISSAAGARGCAGSIAYAVAKGAIPQFARALARELADDNIRVNCVSPGIIRTRFQDSLTPQQVKTNVEVRIPLHHEGRPEDVAEVIVTLVTNEFMTGESVALDGGMTMRIA
jgi:NAD(P)-dependent dehydrogenase (short-subunit alcohol dehydrogenase family)